MVKPRVLIIDDHADDERGKLQLINETLQLIICHPEDVTVESLREADVVVVDYRLDDDWSERDDLHSISLKPMNGLALIAVLRSHENKINATPTSFILRSAHLVDLSSGFKADCRLHVIAGQSGLEWVVDKTTEAEEQLLQIEKFAEATNALPVSWPKDSRLDLNTLLKKWLAIPELCWRELAWNDIEDCHPPVHELFDRKDGLRLLRWLAHRILPYPCFLWTEARLATRLNVSLESLRQSLESDLYSLLKSAEYCGALHGYDGQRRWWRSGVESILWEKTEGRSFDSEYTISELNKSLDKKLVASSLRQSILVVNREFTIQNEAIEVDLAIRIQPDDWPVYAEQAWASIVDASEDSRLAGAVVSSDRYKLSIDAVSENE